MSIELVKINDFHSWYEIIFWWIIDLFVIGLVLGIIYNGVRLMIAVQALGR